MCMRMLTTPRSLLTWALVCVCGAAGMAQQGPSIMPRPTDPVVLAATAYTSDQGLRTLSVWRRDLEATPAASLQYLTRHPERNALPNVVLYAVDAPVASPSAGRVVWVAYDYFASTARPWPSWSADVRVHPATKQIYLVVMKTTSLRGTLSLFEIAKDASVAAFPPNFGIANVDQWPEAPPAVATFAKETPGEVCAPASIGMVPTAKGLLMSVLRAPTTCSSIYLEYDARSKAWRETTVAGSR
jgi:hypothetical protein